MKNVKELRENLIEKYKKFEENKNVQELSVVTACASAIIRSAKVELDYKKHKKDDSEIDFLITKK